MDYMDIDYIEEVPDTPERFLASRNNNNSNSTRNRSDGSSNFRVTNNDYINEKPRNESKEKGKSITIHGNRRLFVRPNNSSNSPTFTSQNSSSSKNVRSTGDNTHHEKGKTLSNLTGQTSNCHGQRSDRGKGVVVGSRCNSSSLDSTQPRVNRHKRLVRNGCISPHNIEKSRQVAEKHVIETVEKDVRVDVGGMPSGGPSNTVDIKDLIAEAKDSRRFKGKGVSHQRNSLVFKEATDANNTMTNVDPTLIDVGQHISRRKSESTSVIDQQKNKTVQQERKNGSNVYSHFEDLEMDSIHRVSAPPDTMSPHAHNFKNRAQLTKRQRGGVVLSNNRHADVASRNGAGSSSLVSRNNSSYEAPGVRDLQLEADEMLARELQEQLYNEEMDSHHALEMAMQQEQSSHAIHAGGRPAFRPTSRGAPVSNVYQQSRSSASRNSSLNRGVQPQSSTSTRLARLRGRFPGRPRTLSSTRSSIFPPNMDVHMRMQILEALEAVNDVELPNHLLAFNDTALPNELLQIGREFNENDYEMLLALDENNHRHGGATHAQINNLPQSTVQAENLQECVICLETPTIGDTIRHLPCLHRFHKDCIDEWLRRKTSCPVCKSSVT